MNKMIFKRLILIQLLTFCFFYEANANQTSSKKLPEPLPLDFALSLADDEMQPEIQKKQAQIKAQLALDKQLQSSRNVQIGLSANAWIVDPSDALSETVDNRQTPHVISFHASKVLYDFGRLTLDKEIEQIHQELTTLQKNIIKRENYLKILNDFFDVLLIDYKHAYDNEALAMAYIRFDRAKTSYEQNKLSELSLMELENKNFVASDNFFDSGQKQRLMRLKLAQSMNRQGQLSENVKYPDWKKFPHLSLKRKLIAYEDLLKTAYTNNKQILLLKGQIQALSLNAERAGLDNYPSLSGQASGHWYARELSGGDKFKLGLQLEVPLYQGGKLDSGKSQAMAKLHEAEAELKLVEMQNEQDLLSTTQKIKSLIRRDKQLSQKVMHDERILEKNRIEYDLEFKSDLGNAMVNLSLSQMQFHQNRFDLAYQWAILDTLIGSY